ncbi:MAG: AMP-binding protein, partial [Ilumatobacteraceae bacterium]
MSVSGVGASEVAVPSPSLSYASGPSAKPRIGRTIGADHEATAERLPDHEAIVVPFQDVRLSYGEFDERVDEVARGLLALGLEKGDR